MHPGASACSRFIPCNTRYFARYLCGPSASLREIIQAEAPDFTRRISYYYAALFLISRRGAGDPQRTRRGDNYLESALIQSVIRVNQR